MRIKVGDLLQYKSRTCKTQGVCLVLAIVNDKFDKRYDVEWITSVELDKENNRKEIFIDFTSPYGKWSKLS